MEVDFDAFAQLAISETAVWFLNQKLAVIQLETTELTTQPQSLQASQKLFGG
jgi:hypothetical protein